MFNHYIEELKKIYLEKLELVENLEDYFYIKKELQKLQELEKELSKLLDKKLLEIF